MADVSGPVAPLLETIVIVPVVVVTARSLGLLRDRRGGGRCDQQEASSEFHILIIIIDNIPLIINDRGLPPDDYE